MREKLPFLTKFFYGFGSLAYGIKDNAFNYFLLFVYVQVFGLAPNLAGLAILLMLVIDAISDPLIGYFSDKTQSKWGRRHPWMYGSAIPGFLFFNLGPSREYESNGTVLVFVDCGCFHKNSNYNL